MEVELSMEPFEPTKRSWRHLGRTLALCAGLLLLVGGIFLPHRAVLAGGDQNGFNQPGNILIADQFNNRVIEVDPQTHKVVWTFGDGSSTPGPTSVVGTNDAQRVGSFTLISGTGA